MSGRAQRPQWSLQSSYACYPVEILFNYMCMSEVQVDRIAIAGFSGSGKSTFAEELSLEFGMPHIELDKCRQKGEIEEATLQSIQKDDQWIVEGVRRYDSVGAILRERTDLIIWLDPSLLVIAGNKMTRTIRAAKSHLLAADFTIGRNGELFSGNFIRSCMTLAAWAKTQTPPLIDQPWIVGHPNVLRLGWTDYRG